MSPFNHTDMGGTGGAFLTTHWSMIEAAGRASRGREEALIGLLLKRYWKPVYCYLRRRGIANEDAKDLTQGFFYEVVLGQDLLNKADAARGRFRSLLLIALNRYVGDVRDKETAQKRMPRGGFVSLDAEDVPEIPGDLSSADAEDTFNYAWIATLLEEVLESVESACFREDKQIHWFVFRDRVLNPILDLTDPPSLKCLIERYDILDESKASNMIVTVKRRLQSTLRRYVRDSVDSDESVQEEWEQIRRFFPAMAQDSE